MSIDLRNRDWLKISDFTAEEVLYLLDLAAQLKAAKYRGSEGHALQGKNIALIFEKTSTRTRCAFEVAAYDQGAHVTYLGPEGSQIGHKESIKDTARVLGRMYDAIEYRDLLAGTRLQRADGRFPPDADAGRHPDDARAFEQAAQPDRLLLPR